MDTLIVIGGVIVLTSVWLWLSGKKQPSDQIELSEEANTKSHLFESMNQPKTAAIYPPTKEMESILEVILKKTYRVILITGKAGTGKSNFVKWFFQNSGYRCTLVAPTGIAARNIGGQTIHSFFHFPWQPLSESVVKKMLDPRVCQKLDFLIIDEISMVRADLFQAIDTALRLNRNEPDTPFGGAHVIIVGDLFQLPPVAPEKDMKILEEMGMKTEFFFSAPVFKSLMDTSFEAFTLSQVFRQDDDQYLEILNTIRENKITPAISKLLDTRLTHSDFIPPDNATILTMTNSIANDINTSKLEALPGLVHAFDAEIAGTFPSSEYPTEKHIELKVGAKIMVIKNMGKLVNGSIGIITRIEQYYIIIAAEGGIHRIEQYTWKREIYTLVHGEIKKKVTGEFKQLPIRYGWAITVHKSQGLTLDKVILNLQKSAFAPGQLYTALSRCRRLSDLYLEHSVTSANLKVNTVVDFFIKNYVEKESDTYTKR